MSRYVSPLIGLLVLLGVIAAAATAVSAKVPLPAYNGAMTFPKIGAPSDPEEYSWEVSLSEQELVLIDDRHAQVYYTEGHHPAFAITTAPAHDAVGSTVPTGLGVSEGNVITLTVHHRAGNPAKGGASFVYPVTYGEGYEVGSSTVQIQTPPAESTPGLTVDQSIPSCGVPRLTGKPLKTAREELQSAGCKLGKVRGSRSKTATVVRQSHKAGRTLAAGAKISVKLGE